MLPGMTERAVAEVLDERRCVLGEGPWFDERSGRVWWVDIIGRSVLWRDLAPGAATRPGATGALATAAHVGAAVPRAGGGMVLCLPDGPLLLDDDGGRRKLGSFADADAAAGRPRTADTPKLRANDAKADPYGRLWLGTMAYDQTPGAGALYRLDPGAAAPERVLDGVTISNGLGWSRDGSLMYYIDTPTRCIDVFDYDGASGALADRRTFVEIEERAGAPDGMCVDAAGGIWVALWRGGAVRRYRPDGVLDREVSVGTAKVTSCTFAGPEFDQLVITTASVDTDDEGAGSLYRYRPGDVVGTAVHRYAG
jgi:sugar lactone lactonase YvrE